MPILNTGLEKKIHEVLKEKGLAEDIDSLGLKELLKKNDLAPNDLLKELRLCIDSAESPTEKLRAIENGLKLNKLLGSDESGGGQTFILNIGSAGEQPIINPIYIPRKTTLAPTNNGTND